MHASLLTVAGLCAMVMAAPDKVVKRQSANPSLSSVLAEISSLYDQILPPSSIAAELTGIPASVTELLSDPSAASVYESQVIASGFPSWFTALPSDAQSYILAAPGKYATIYPEIVSLQVAAGITSLGSAAGTGVSTTNPSGPIVTASGSATGKSNSNTTVTTGSLSSTGTAATTKAASSSGSATAKTSASSSSSSAGAAPTNALAAGVMGAVGFLGLALAL